MEEYSPMIYQIIHSLHIYKNHDEFYQIGLIALWEASNQYDETKGDFLSYAYATVKGRILTEIAKQTRREERNIYPKEEFWEIQASPLSRKPLELADLLFYCGGLTPKQQKWVIGTFYYGKSMSEIAKEEMVSESAVKKWKKAAMDKIKIRMLNE
ncbi:sigma-70 family RNA polymerase sigma factor [Heyndrickxia oleronia]|uniref:sigma-70 family RNA polymerase sigma factor n=1 Tax=Heyndrickxia oleronia TaxID=38875 RepID=UPI00333CB834